MVWKACKNRLSQRDKCEISQHRLSFKLNIIRDSTTPLCRTTLHDNTTWYVRVALTRLSGEPNVTVPCIQYGLMHMYTTSLCNATGSSFSFEQTKYSNTPRWIRLNRVCTVVWNGSFASIVYGRGGSGPIVIQYAWPSKQLSNPGYWLV